MTPEVLAPTFKFSHPIRVRQGETDAQGRVLCPMFCVYREAARTEYFRNLKFSYPEQWKSNFHHVMTIGSCHNEKRQAHFDDELLIFAKISAIQKTNFTFSFEIYQKAGGQLISKATSTHAVIDPKKWAIIRVPDFFREIVSQFENQKFMI
ncbi:MAG: hypothetical protein A2Z91_09310 [Deltaproteobacteria bacterium GWA2_38_16]|nr:MAG: hypothetical protein A2Z91_09310 [Deltaproteobacteria bacterium GWA2_38_16]OGQ02506.1 MAG: hypothetical protein A3D19_09420 [Deltaproteobacteria bacterium RIFCSPHIGHO2_02_FULL_38_15]OGQ60907.1 MAG: hypothetical protein A3G92_00500 [Deltaproteobacteria bacterium RIFCSPLOWO2_12_FULL_38_8]HBQ21039.1 hypothetical protein [Deltaproteobacteria bacterium]